MRLKKIRLAGFKSFVDPTNIPFPGDMTAVVGPNGCGKSNVIDAVRWVLGESSAKNLRGEAMTDVIFNGSSARKPVSQCSVELVFDNSSGRVSGEFAKYTELSVKRIVTKDAVSSYHLNGTKCRRRDITDLFLGTGLGPRSYAIIEQGMISRLIESKPQELRVFIEEAAGISKYKERRKETLNRISHTKDNLSRLDDVRQELGDQLAKLKRQASAANRFKELKAEERELKAQLAAMRYLSQAELLKASDDIIAGHQKELETLIYSRQGDESQLQALKNDQAIQKQAISDVQQSIYLLGNDITKLEQSVIFARKRSEQIETETTYLQQQSDRLQTELSSIDNELESNQSKLLEAEPEKFVFEEQLEELKSTQLTFQERTSAASSKLKEVQDEYYQKKQAIQQKHSQLQQTLSLQQRTESRIAELKNELQEVDDIELIEVGELSAQMSQLEQALQDAEQKQQQVLQDFETQQAQHEDLTTQLREIDTLIIQAEAELNALAKLQQSDDMPLPEFIKSRSYLPSWQAFHAHPGYEKALEACLGLYENSLIVEALSQSDIQHEAEHETQLEAMKGAQALFLASGFTDYKRENAIAAYLEEDRVPTIFNAILLAKDTQQAMGWLPNLDSGETIVSVQGEIFAKDLYVPFEKSGDGKVVRKARIASLQTQLTELSDTQNTLQNEVHNAKQSLQEVSESKQLCAETLNQLKNQQALLQKDIDNAVLMKSQSEARSERISADIQSNTESLEQELMRCELLSEEIEDANVELSEIEAQTLNFESDKQGVDVQLQGIVSQLQLAQQRLHEHAMLIQGIQNSHQLLSEQQKTKKTQLKDNQDKLALLIEEQETLSLPNDQQQEKLQSMLDDKNRLEVSNKQKQQTLSELEENIVSVEKGQVGINDKVEGIRQRIESERISAQTAKVKAQTFLDQLTDMKIDQEEAVNNIPEQAKEDDYQSALDKVLSSVSRLGAVNLAAVEEYDEQAERKEHLDAQNTDLCDALDTLENAMRKIDNETRSRFKDTFEKVNNDLKTLFPKVFGGGSAYLALTDDDLLDTGVTIMARPPGKKNSTIALLSGGEKALTALSLVFAIFRLNPAPFCLLDEVDAPLDDANVGRFCKLVSEMSKTVQFIYITHNKVAMEMATHLSGVTMAEPGVSRMVSVDMEQALAIAE